MIPIVFLSILPVVLSVVSFFLLKYWVKTRRETAFLIAVATGLAAGGTVAWRGYQFKHAHTSQQDEMLLLNLACTAFLIIFAVPLGIKLYRAWIGIQVSPEEKAPGSIGVRAWLTPANLIISAIIAACAAGAYDYQFLAVLVLLVGCLLIQPIINTASDPASAPALAAAPEPTLTAEREKVLSLLENGRITAEESADLLNALGSTAHSVKPPTPVSRQQRMALIGAALVLLGFFLPWLSYNPGKELSRMTGQMEGMTQGFLPEGMPGMPTIATQNVNISGGDIGHGLGWLVLLLGLGVAALPHVATTLDAATRRMISFLSLGLGGIVLLWLVAQNLRLINVGLILALGGYAVEFLGLLKSRPQGAGVTAPTVAGQV
jgi:hypothetical protein